MNFLRKKEDGFVALFTVLLVSVILAMALGIASISLKEIVLSSSASEGSKAFYAADSGIECGLFLERSGALTSGSTIGLSCNNSMLIDYDYLSTGDEEAAVVHKFSIPFGSDPDNGLCTYVEIKTDVYGVFSYSKIIESKGSNLPCDQPNNPKRVERSVRVTY